MIVSICSYNLPSVIIIAFVIATQQTFTCSKSIIETHICLKFTIKTSVDFVIYGRNTLFSRLRVSLNGRDGPFSEVVSCKTYCCAPARPQPPRITQKSKKSLTLKWTVSKWKR